MLQEILLCELVERKNHSQSIKNLIPFPYPTSCITSYKYELICSQPGKFFVCNSMYRAVEKTNK